MRRYTIAWLCILGMAAQAHDRDVAFQDQNRLMIPDITNSRIMLFDAFDGTLLDPSFVDMTAQGGFPVNAVRVGEEIWVSNQVNFTVHRFTRSGSYLGDVTGTMDYVRGFDVVGGKVFAANVNPGPAGAARRGVVVIDIARARVDNYFHTGSDGQGFGFDVLAHGRGTATGLLIPDQSSTDGGLDDGEDLDLFAFDGTFLRTFHDSDGVTGIDNPMQLARTPRNTILAAGFTGPLFGIFEYDKAGREVNFFLIPDTNVFGVGELGNGRILFTTFDGVFVLDPTNPNTNTNVQTVVAGLYGGFIEPLAETGGFQ